VLHASSAKREAVETILRSDISDTNDIDSSPGQGTLFRTGSISHLRYQYQSDWQVVVKNSILVETFDHLTTIIVAFVRLNVALNAAL
jgi:hypothetical protein